MKAVVYHGPGEKAWEEVPNPTLVDDTDAIVRVDAVTICGTDLHILKGDVPAVTDGRILGHEAVGTVESVGAGVKNVQVGDRVLVSCITACGACRYCREGSYGQCLGGGGWILGHKIDGTQAEYVRVPFADTSTYPVPAGVTDEELLMLADILPTGYEVGVLNGAGRPGRRRRRRRRRTRSACRRSWAPGCSARATSSPSTWPTAASRRPSSSAPTSSSTTAGEDPLAVVRELTDGLGADVADRGRRRAGDVRARRRAGPPGRPRSPTSACTASPPTLHLEELWIRNVTITTGLVDTYSTPTLLRLVAGHQIDAGPLRHPPLRPRRVRRGLRRVRRAARDRRAQGRAHPVVSRTGRRPGSRSAGRLAVPS